MRGRRHTDWSGSDHCTRQNRVATAGFHDVLLEGICDQGQNFLVLIQQEHCPQIAQPLVGKPWRRQELETFNLAEMRSLAKGEEI